MTRAFAAALATWLLAAAAPVEAQQPAQQPSQQPAAEGAPATPPPADHQIAAAVAPLPEPLREGAAVLGYAAAGRLVTLRPGANEMICLADKPGDERFHVACYHRDLDPFMKRGRDLRAEGRTEAEVDSVRVAEIEAGTLSMPREPRALYSLTGKPDSYDPATRTVSGANPLYVVYIAYATEESTGLSAQPGPGKPWIMFPGTPGAHIMVIPESAWQPPQQEPADEGDAAEGDAAEGEAPRPQTPTPPQPPSPAEPQPQTPPPPPQPND